MKTTNKAAWILFISRRFARVDTGGRNAAAAILSSLGIAFGVMTLIVVIAVMNGFQTGKIESILEIQSFHLRAYPQSAEQQIVLASELQKNPLVRTFIPFMEAQALSVGKNGRQAARNFINIAGIVGAYTDKNIGPFLLQSGKTL